SFQLGGAEIPNVRATVIWRKSQRHRAGVVSIRAGGIALIGQCSVVGYSVCALLTPPSFLLPMTVPCTKSHIHLWDLPSGRSGGPASLRETLFLWVVGGEAAHHP